MPVSSPRILLLSAYDASSHKRWREQLAGLLPEYHWHSLSLSPRFFRWRIRGNPLSWLDEPCLGEPWDLLVATSMVDLATLKGIHPRLAGTPCVLYMHENQFAFPVSEGQSNSVDPQMVNLYGAMAADCVVFNSEWNRTSFLDGVRDLLSKMPDAVPLGLPERLRDKSLIIPVPIEDRLFTDCKTDYNWDSPHLLWNHRWEYDKGPDRLLELLKALDRRSIPFRLSVVGERFRKYPGAFDDIHERFSDRIVHWGYLDSRADYDQLLMNADVVVSTAVHDFQGLSMLEAMAAGCLPLAPDRLAYREYVPADFRYGAGGKPCDEAASAADCLAELMRCQPEPCRPDSWRGSVLAEKYRNLFQHVMGARVGLK
ncbi:DUF3524 domain-containing protein [Marinobacter salinexigens]|uniref:tRNA-queuosine alpha-mannosyltransferase n=1 Tax=Marinobacter salinexigens TaxID=2919747 RepID=A0A5B0VAV3_9GAMM|nr:DUF3524 domain-containing protein [Marinobacter salinexigens]KAA1171305.1 DUF3524 domain-containing protein [Marinobacter salinexigens]